MKLRTLAFVSIAALAGAEFASAQPASPPVGSGGLVHWLSQNLDEVYLRPNTNFAGYRKVIIDQPKVVFDRYWLKSINWTRDPSRWISSADQQDIADNLTTVLGRSVGYEFASRGYEVVKDPGPDVLRINPTVADFFLNGPDVTSSNLSREFTQDAGQATLILEARDSVTGVELARIVDRSIAREELRNKAKFANRTTQVSNLFWMDGLFRSWTGYCIKEFAMASDRVKTSSAVTQQPLASVNH
jgi:hypothetical protein